jgi:hypothetical protein
MGETLDSWPAGANFIFRINIANVGAAGAGAIELIYAAGEGSEFELLYGLVGNADTVSRAVDVRIDNGTTGEDLAWIIRQRSVDAAQQQSFPGPGLGSATVGESGPARYIVAGPCRLRMAVNAVADGQDADFAGAFRIKGARPIRSTVGQGAEVVTVTTERVV